MAKRNDLGTLTIRLKPQGDGFRVNEVVGKLVQAFEARITCHDWYADMRKKTVEIAELREGAGKPFSKRPLEDLDSAARNAGLRIGLAVPMTGGGYAIGTITKNCLVLSARCPLKDDESVKAVVAFLRSLDIVEDVEVT